MVATRLLGNAIWRLTGSDVGEHVHLFERLLRSAAFRDHPDHIVRALKESTARAPELVLHASEAVFARWEGEQRSARLTYTCKDAFALVLRAYTDAFARPDKERALDLPTAACAATSTASRRTSSHTTGAGCDLRVVLGAGIRSQSLSADGSEAL